MTFFSFQRVAEGYASHRPYYHPLVMAKIRTHLELKGRVDKALDVGCGTGLSTTALREVADHVVGTDSSAAMISVATGTDQDDIVFQCAPAEQLRFPDASFDIVTVCGAINWIDRGRFLPEARRVLKHGGWIVIYDSFITEQMRGMPAYTQWYQEQYLRRYPKPPRDETPLLPLEAEQSGFRMRQMDFNHEASMSTAQYIEFMLTQSNVINAVDMGSESLSEARAWMHRTLAPVLPGDDATFMFAGYIWYLRTT